MMCLHSGASSNYWCRGKQNHPTMGRKRRAKSKSSGGAASSSGGDMDDIMRQLQLQRERQKQKTKDNKVDVSSTTEGKKQKTRETAPSIKQEIGDFRFDPISNRYLPKSSFNKQDRFEAQTKVKNVSIDRLRWEKRNSISDEDVRRIIFHGSALDYSRPQSDMQAQNKKTRKRHSGDESSITQQPDVEQQIPCSGRIVHKISQKKRDCKHSRSKCNGKRCYCRSISSLRRHVDT